MELRCGRCVLMASKARGAGAQRRLPRRQIESNGSTHREDGKHTFGSMVTQTEECHPRQFGLKKRLERIAHQRRKSRCSCQTSRPSTPRSQSVCYIASCFLPRNRTTLCSTVSSGREPQQLLRRR